MFKITKKIESFANRRYKEWPNGNFRAEKYNNNQKIKLNRDDIGKSVNMKTDTIN